MGCCGKPVVYRPKPKRIKDESYTYKSTSGKTTTWGSKQSKPQYTKKKLLK